MNADDKLDAWLDSQWREFWTANFTVGELTHIGTLHDAIIRNDEQHSVKVRVPRWRVDYSDGDSIYLDAVDYDEACLQAFVLCPYGVAVETIVRAERQPFNQEDDGA